MARATAERRQVPRRLATDARSVGSPLCPVRDRAMMARYLYNGFGRTVTALRPTVMALEVSEHAYLLWCR
ncbi:hypothetical protein [Ferrimicrobium sp.]|uniref:hypothetical protein n=1 Tax=Ferrimicrobium sp. TaxID=2926050 RepID=UPI0026200EC3|nr:hypothetical protein [Ferrimicrobium sp.]